MSKKKKKVTHDRIEQMELPFLWADKNGILSSRRRYQGRLNALRLPHLQLSPRELVNRASRLLLSQSLSSWLPSRSLEESIPSGVNKQLFEMWLYRKLHEEEFGAISIVAIVGTAEKEFAIERWEVIQYLADLTRENARFKSDGEVITVR